MGFRGTHKLFRFVPFVIGALALFAQSQALAESCLRRAIAELQRSDTPHFVSGKSEYPITYGLEMELNRNENPNLVLDYRLASIPEVEWVKLSKEQRLKKWKEFDERPLFGHEKGALVRLSKARKVLPETIEREGNGNVEMNGLIFKTVKETKSFLKYINQRYKRGSVQGHVVYVRTPVEGTAGWVIFEADRAQLETLERNYERYLENPAVVPGKNLSHHSLGPLGEGDRRTYLNAEQQANAGNRIGETWTSRIIYGPAFRDKGYPDGRVGSEFRQFHKRHEALTDAMSAYAITLEKRGSLTAYKPFSDTTLIASRLPAERASVLKVEIDSTQWKTYFDSLGRQVKQKFPNLSYGGAPVNERFYYPLRDWANHPLVTDLPEAKRLETIVRIETATKKFIKDSDALVKNNSVDDAAITQMQILVARWAHETKLNPLFENFLKKQFRETPQARGPPEVLPEPEPVAAPPEKPPELLSALTSKPVTLGKVTVPEYKMNPEVANTPAYEQFLNQSVEVIFIPTAPFGHIAMRVGKKMYSLNFISSSTISEFSPRLGTEGKKGIVFNLSPGAIKAAQDQIDKLYGHSATHNMPPFDAYSSMLEVLTQPDGTLKYKSPSPDYANNGRLQATIVDADGKSVLRTPDGYEYPLVKRQGHYYVQSLSCATSCTLSLRNILGLDVGFNHGAESLRDELLNGNPGRTAPSAVIDYGRTPN